MARMVRAFWYTLCGRYLAARYTGISDVCQSFATKMTSCPYSVPSIGISSGASSAAKHSIMNRNCTRNTASLSIFVKGSTRPIYL
jgi:hypothetical protein